MRNLEVQIGQLSNDLKARPQGSFPWHTEVPKRDGKEQCKAVTLRSGLSYERPKMPVEVEKPSTSIQNSPSEAEKEKTTSGEGEASGASSQENSSFLLIPPFPQILAKKNQETQFRKFLDILKQLHINIPLLDALEQMPNYAKFLKDIVSRKKKLGEHEMVAMTKCSSEAVGSPLPIKCKDPDSFTIPCSIGGKNLGRALCDLGASINLMPLSVFKELGIGEARPTTVTLQLADRSIKKPEGKIKDKFHVDKFIFPADFIILDCKADLDVPIILGRPFLATGDTIFNVRKGEITMKVNNEEVKFNVLDAMKLPGDLEEWAKVIVYTDHSALKYLFAKKDAKPRLIRWILLLQEFDTEVRDCKGTENQVADHLSRLESPLQEGQAEIREQFVDEQLLRIENVSWYADIANYLVSRIIPHEFSRQQVKKFLHDVRYYRWDEPFLYKLGPDGILRKCVAEEEQKAILEACHMSPYGGHFDGQKTTAKVLQSGFLWPTLFRDAHSFAQVCDKC
ncbi:uncharacterized protein LOC111022971 [Momordica charantia]|uniref:Uncharacterized protein LOC111022971 n=1 Tax=Momordica charantia TaxID=3673 RepID=A0A6J1DTH7_MOMCH|nr:uncharacterized protein LOC111022971 [Momordica charantia]